MKAWLLEGLGGLEKLKVGEAALPMAKADEVVLKVDFASLNPADRYLAEGQYPARPTFPHILGRDAVGTVTAVGAAVTTLKVGDRVCILRTEVGVNTPGTFAEFVAVPAASLTAVPTGWTDEQAASAPLVYLTAYQALTQFGALEKAVVVVTGASGGVGVASVQLAAAMGHTVVALSRSDEKRKKLEGLGASLTLDPHDTQWRKRIKEYLGQRRVDLAVDNIGGSLFSEVLDTLGMNGRISCVGRLAGPVPSFNTAGLFFRRIRIGGVAVGTYTPAEAQAAWQAVLKLLSQAKAQPLVDSVWPFEKLIEAFGRLASGPMGKVVLQVKG